MITGPNPIFQYFVNTRPVESVFDQWYRYVDAEINSVSLDSHEAIVLCSYG